MSLEVAFGIAIGVSTVETMMLFGIYLAISTDTEAWKEHKKNTSERLHGAWKVKPNGKDEESISSSNGSHLVY